LGGSGGVVNRGFERPLKKKVWYYRFSARTPPKQKSHDNTERREGRQAKTLSFTRVEGRRRKAPSKTLGREVESHRGVSAGERGGLGRKKLRERQTKIRLKIKSTLKAQNKGDTRIKDWDPAAELNVTATRGTKTPKKRRIREKGKKEAKKIGETTNACSRDAETPRGTPSPRKKRRGETGKNKLCSAGQARN